MGLRKPDPRPACNPSGPFDPVPAGTYTCRCGERVYPRRGEGRNEWVYATASGERVRDDRPAGLIADPAAWWARLAKTNIGAYSNLTAALALGQWQWFHVHDANVSEPAEFDTVTVPWCCGDPMWASPDGWVCRVSKRLFPYTENGHVHTA